MNYLLQQKAALKTTTQNPMIAKLTKHKQVALAVDDIKNEVFWKADYCLLQGEFSVLQALWYCDSNVPAMDKIYFLAPFGSSR